MTTELKDKPPLTTEADEAEIELTPLEKFESSVNLDKRIVAKNNLFDAIYHNYTNKMFDFGQTVDTFDFNHIYGFDKSYMSAELFPKFKEVFDKSFIEEG
jgi:hypothetical protein